MSLALWVHPANVLDCGRAVGARMARAARGHRRMTGDAAAIVEAGIDRTWNGRSFTASPGWFNTFWTRDMCFSSVALARLGGRFHDRLVLSLAWALDGWQRRGSHVTTTFHPGGVPADVYDYGVDSLPLLLAALGSIGLHGDALVARYGDWLADEVRHFEATVIDPETGLVRADRTFSAHRDTVTNRSNAYGNSMVALLAATIAARPGWELPTTIGRHFPNGDFGRLLREHFWMTERGCYRDALGSDDTTGEANIWPFWTGVEPDRQIRATALATLRREGYADPLPLRYEVQPRPDREVWLVRLLLPDYQGSSIWTSLGAMYLSLLSEVDPAEAARGIEGYCRWIQREGTYWEVLDERGGCWTGRARLMLGEESMLWGSIFLDLLRNRAAGSATLMPATAPDADVVPVRDAAVAAA